MFCHKKEQDAIRKRRTKRVGRGCRNGKQRAWASETQEEGRGLGWVREAQGAANPGRAGLMSWHRR